MKAHANLISESLLVMETIDYLVSVGGSASASRLVDHVMSIASATGPMARVLMTEVSSRDPRLSMNGDNVELNEPDHDQIDFNDTSFVVFDLETTGAKAPPCRVIEIGAYMVRNGSVVDEFHSLVNPETYIPEFICSLTNISNDMVADAPKFSEVGDAFLHFIGDSILVAHNSPFDIGFLNYEIGRVYQEYKLSNPDLCTVQLSRKLLPDLHNHKLKTLADHYSIELINHHRAGPDAKATAGVFINLLGDLERLGIRDYGSARRFAQKKLYVRPRKAAA